ncbi:FG-GAP-like repeat-containing protein [Terracidiphilus gabretensis]|uniref:FG-GAP-like repeat-containing protein n=1 Tax=Terracidiphilus gabretensis TaxID=1577687 RepID=UPI001E3BD5EC|nr:FG-GAP-like repeat-containing protein [Terracidiphilus gabretensis]
MPAISNYGDWSPAVADFNGDGIPDIAVYAYNELIIFLGSASGTFTEVTTPIVPNVNVGSAQLIVGDFNQDGALDLAVNANNSDNTTTLSIFSGNGDGTFTVGAAYPLNSYYYNGDFLDAAQYIYPPVVVADFNHDGIPDMAVLTLNSNVSYVDLTILLGKGDGTFTAVTGLTGLSNVYLPYAFSVSDFNGDGIPDVAVAFALNDQFEDGNLNTYLGKGDGTFSPTPSTSTYINAAPTNMVVADFNGDGRPDIAVNTLQWIPPDSGNFSPITIALYLASGNGNFTGELASAQTEQVSYIYLGNFTGDVNPELWGEGEQGNHVFVYDPTSGNFDETSAPPTLGVGSLPDIFYVGEAVAADINGDGITDFVSPTFTDITSSISTGSVPISGFPSGGYTIQADYSGDSNFAPSTSSIGSPQTTKLTLSMSPNAGLIAGQTVTFTATLTPYSYPGYSTDGESINFLYGGFYLGTSKLSNGVATLVTQNIVAGLNAFSAVYPGDLNFFASTSNTVTTTVSKAQPTLTLSAGPSIGIYGEATTLTATFNGYNLGSVYGEQITFLNGGQVLGTGSLSPDGIATLNISTLPVGTDSLTATYAGDNNNLSVTSNALPYTVIPEPPVVTSPTPGSQLSGSTVTFQWTPLSGVIYQLAVGTKWPGSEDIYGGGATTATSATISGIPTNGVNVYVMLRSVISGTVYTNFYTYTAAGSLTPPALTMPAPGSHLSGSTATFQWSSGSGPSAYLINVGTKWPGADDIYGSGVTTATSAAVSGLPTNGVNVYVLLRYLFNGVWTDLNYTYTAAGSITPPVMTTPAPGSVLPGASVTFNWTPGTGVTAYSLFAGTYGPGYFNIGGSPTLTTTSFTLPNIPTNGKPVYVTLRYQINGVWQTTGYTYTAQ